MLVFLHKIKIVFGMNNNYQKPLVRLTPMHVSLLSGSNDVPKIVETSGDEVVVNFGGGGTPQYGDAIYGRSKQNRFFFEDDLDDALAW